MDSDEEMIQQIMDDDVSEHLPIIACFQKMLDDAEEKKRPRCGGSRPGRKKSKPR
jgi:hypothetical protein